MKSIQSARILGLGFLFLTAHFLTLGKSILSAAQEQSKTPALKGTRWEGTIHPASGIRIVQIVEFPETGKVVVSFATVFLGTDNRIEHNTSGPGRPEEERGRATIVPGVPFQILDTRSESGTYKQNGNFIQLEFPNRLINATINGNIMEGEVISKQNNARERWLVGRKSASAGYASDTLSSSFSVSSDNLLLGTWKHEDYAAGIDIAGFKSPPKISRIVTVSFSQNGILETVIQEGFINNVSFLGRTEKTNWMYVPKTVSSGVLRFAAESEPLRRPTS